MIRIDIVSKLKSWYRVITIVNRVYRGDEVDRIANLRLRTKLADGAFTVAGPEAWNVLRTSDLRNSASRTVFLSNLKTDILTVLWIFKFFL